MEGAGQESAPVSTGQYAPPLDESPSAAKRAAFAILATVAVPLLVFTLIEGGSSLVLLGYDLHGLQGPPTERRHTDYDTLLGWVGRPHFRAPDAYGPGIGLQTNAHGFRGEREVEPTVPPGRIRVVCSGDSFTLGWGVADSESWCARLEGLDPRLQTINMGQGGYGIDQAYLWYMRDGRPLSHQAHIFAFIAEDFRRMRRRDFRGFPKPLLVRSGDSLEVENVPIPRLPYTMPRLTVALFAAQPVLARLRASELLALLTKRIPSGRATAGPADADSATWLVAERVFASLAAVNRAQGSALLVVMLPMREDYDGVATDRWRQRLRDAAPRDDFTFVDLVRDFRSIPEDHLDSLFSMPTRGVQGHYGPLGHRWVAERLHGALVGALGARPQSVR